MQKVTGIADAFGTFVSRCEILLTLKTTNKQRSLKVTSRYRIQRAPKAWRNRFFKVDFRCNRYCHLFPVTSIETLGTPVLSKMKVP